VKTIYLLVMILVILGASMVGIGLRLESDTYEKADFGEKLNHQRNEQLLERLFDESLTNVHNIIQETSRSTDLLYGVLSHNQELAEQLLHDVLSRHTGERIDALIIEAGNGEYFSASSFAVLEAGLELAPIIKPYLAYNRWKVASKQKDGTNFIILRNVQPVIDPDSGEVVAKLHALILLNDNFWVMSEILGVLNAESVILFHRGDKLGSLSANDDGHIARKSNFKPTGKVHGENRQYHLSFNSDERFRLSVDQHLNAVTPIIISAKKWSLYITLLGAAIIAIALLLLTLLIRRFGTGSNLKVVTDKTEKTPEPHR